MSGRQYRALVRTKHPVQCNQFSFAHEHGHQYASARILPLRENPQGGKEPTHIGNESVAQKTPQQVHNVTEDTNRVNDSHATEVSLQQERDIASPLISLASETSFRGISVVRYFRERMGEFLINSSAALGGYVITVCKRPALHWSMSAGNTSSLINRIVLDALNRTTQPLLAKDIVVHSFKRSEPSYRNR